MTCKHEGCNKWAFSYYENLKERSQIIRSTQNYKCSLHSNLDRILSLNKLNTSKTFVVEIGNDNTKKYWDGLYGVLMDNSYYAKADDFPIGTKLTITTNIELPK